MELLFFFCVHSSATTLDCSKLQGSNAQAICKSSRLKSLDKQVHALYAKRGLTDFDSLFSRQASCKGSEACLDKAYVDEIYTLEHTEISAKQDECVAGEAKAAFEGAADLKDYKQSKEQNFVRETFTLADGTRVSAGQGGCAHYDRSVTFTIPKAQGPAAKFDVGIWIKRSLELLTKLPDPNGYTQAITAEIEQQKKKLLSQKPVTDGRRHVLEVTDENGYNTVSIAVTQGRNRTEVTLGVNTAL